MNCTNCALINAIAAPFALLLMVLYKLFQGGAANADSESLFAYALALFSVAVIVRVLLLPFQMKSKRGMLRQTRLQPKINELQKRHGANKQKLNEEMAKLYKEEGVNPASGCLWSFIQMPIMIALFYAIRQPITLMMNLGGDLWEKAYETFNTTGQIYTKAIDLVNRGILVIPERLQDPATGFYRANDFYAELFIAQDISTHWEYFRDIGLDGFHRISFYLGNINLAETPNWQFFWSPDTVWAGGAWLPGLLLFLLPLLSGGAQFLSAHIMRKTTPQPTTEAAGQGSATTIMKLMPLMSVWFGFMLPAALSFYWIIGTFLQIIQDLWLNKRYTRILDAEDAEKEKARKEKEEEIEAKRLETERLKAEGLIAQNPNTSKRKKQKTERQGQREKAAEWEKKNAPPEAKKSKDEPGRVDNRRYARGRAYDPDRYANSEADNDEDLISDDAEDVVEVTGGIVSDDDKDIGADDSEG